jgi:hypothetical protein
MAEPTCRSQGCDQPATEHSVACFRDWMRVPDGLRRDVYAAAGRYPGAYQVAINAAAEWLAEHPRTHSQPKGEHR